MLSRAWEYLVLFLLSNLNHKLLFSANHRELLRLSLKWAFFSLTFNANHFSYVLRWGVSRILNCTPSSSNSSDSQASVQRAVRRHLYLCAIYFALALQTICKHLDFVYFRDNIPGSHLLQWTDFLEASGVNFRQWPNRSLYFSQIKRVRKMMKNVISRKLGPTKLRLTLDTNNTCKKGKSHSISEKTEAAFYMLHSMW